MKRILLSTLLAVSVLLSCMPSVSAVYLGDRVVRTDMSADTDRNDTVNIRDLAIAYAGASGNDTLTAHETALADVNKDGSLNMNDVITTYRTISKGSALPTTHIGCEVRYLDLSGGGENYVSNYDVIADEETFAAFKDSHFKTDPKLFDVTCDFGSVSMIVVPMQYEQSYVASVSADENTVYVSVVEFHPAGHYYIEQCRYAFVMVPRRILDGKTVQRLYYKEPNVYHAKCSKWSMITFVDDRIEACAASYSDELPVVFESVQECEEFKLDNPWDDFTGYDEAFFEENVLVRTIKTSMDEYTLSTVFTPGYTASDEVLMLKHCLDWHFEAETPRGGEYVFYEAVSREHYKGQDIVVMDRYTKVMDGNVTMDVPFEEVYREDNAPINDTLKEVKLFRDWIMLKYEHMNDTEGVGDYSADYKTDPMNNKALILVKAYDNIESERVFVEKVERTGTHLKVYVVYDRLSEYEAQEPYHGRLLLEVADADIEFVETVELVPIYLNPYYELHYSTC